MLAAIEQSRHYILAEFYLVESGRTADAFIAALNRASARGGGECVRSSMPSARAASGSVIETGCARPASI